MNLVKRFYLSILLPVLLGAGLSSCLKEEGRGLLPEVNRTVLFYLAADNSLRSETALKIAALAASAGQVPERSHLLVYEDGGTEQGGRLSEIVPGVNGAPARVQTVKEYGPVNSASRAAFSRVLNDVVLGFPASDYGLVMFSHGSGWLPAGTYRTTRSVAMDGEDEFDLGAFADGIPDGQFRFIVFESCLMAGVEVAYELRNKTGYLLASSAEIVSPGFMPVYDKLLGSLFRPEPDLTGFASAYYDYVQQQSGDEASCTVSVLRPVELTSIKSLLATAESRVRDWKQLPRDSIQHFDRREKNRLFYDLAGYLAVIGSETEQEQLAGILDKAVLYQAATEQFMPGSEYGFAVRQHCGLTIYIPGGVYPKLDAARKKLSLFSEFDGGAD